MNSGSVLLVGLPEYNIATVKIINIAKSSLMIHDASVIPHFRSLTCFFYLCTAFRKNVNSENDLPSAAHRPITRLVPDFSMILLVYRLENLSFDLSFHKLLFV